METLRLNECRADAETILRHPEIYSCIKDDGSPPAETFSLPDGSVNLVVYIDGPVACFILHELNFVTMECHVQVLPEYRNRSGEIGQAVVEWTRHNTVAKKLIAWIPFDCENVKNFAIDMGFVVEGVSEDSIMKQGKLLSQWLVGIKLWD